MKPTQHLTLLLLAACALLQSCAHPALRQSEELQRANQWQQADEVLQQALKEAPRNAELGAAARRLREQRVQRLLLQLETQRGAARWDAALESLQQLREIDPHHPRLAWYAAEVERGPRQEAQLKSARALLKEGRLDRAEKLARELLAESPQNPAVQLLLSQIAQARPLEYATGELAPAFQKPVTLEFREAPLRQVFEALARASNINFVFDKDVRGDQRITVFLRQVTLDEAMRVILSTQQLERKLLNDSSVLIYPATQAKQREHQELVTRTLYLTNADVKQVQALLRTIAKVRDIHIDERLNLLVVRDTPEVLRLVDRLVASVDLPEPEVMLEVEVMELASDRLDQLGLQWPETVQYGLIGFTGQVPLGERHNFRYSVANPAVVATIKGGSGNTNLLANPKIRVRNRDKAKVLIGQKVPVFTTTTNFSVGASVAASVSYLDVGLKLEVEPSIQLDNDVAIKVNLEVSNLIKQVTGPGGTTAYEVGTRQTSTTLRLADGQTQILAGLINDEDRRSASGVPGLSGLPLVGRLFGVQTDNRNKTEIVMLITPRIVRNLALPDAALMQSPGGVDASPGAASARFRPEAKAGVGLSSAGGLAGLPRPAPSPVAPPQQAQPQQAAPAEVVVQLDVTPQVAALGTISVTLKQDSPHGVKGELEYDPNRVQPAQAIPGLVPGRLPVELGARGERAFVFRALPAASGQVLNFGVSSLQASGLNGESPPVRAEGSGLVTVDADKSAPR